MVSGISTFLPFRQSIDRRTIDIDFQYYQKQISEKMELQ
jgi:hypothetical protein